MKYNDNLFPPFTLLFSAFRNSFVSFFGLSANKVVEFSTRQTENRKFT